jgi:hypothetical protein
MPKRSTLQQLRLATGVERQGGPMNGDAHAGCWGARTARRLIKDVGAGLVKLAVSGDEEPIPAGLSNARVRSLEQGVV